MGLLDYADLARKKLKGLLGEMPLVQMAQGRAEMPTKAGLLESLKAMPVFAPDAGESAYEAAMNIGPMGLGKIVYHGSPHKFDKFDASKIGTGEGAQAYGHGVYLADSPDVAKGYKEGLSSKYPVSHSGVIEEDGKFLAWAKPTDGREVQVLHTAATKKEAQKALKEYMADKRGALYKADLPDEWIPKMLDWDKPIGEQKDLIEALRKSEAAGIGGQGLGWRGAPEGMWDRAMAAPSKTGEWLYREIANNDPKATAEAMRALGIPGIRYLDGGSRGKGQGSYNYVVFPGLEDQVKILERNGIPLSGLLGGQ